MSNPVIVILHHAYLKAQADVCDKPRSKDALDKLIRVREVQLRAAKHYGVAVMKGVRA